MCKIVTFGALSAYFDYRFVIQSIPRGGLCPAVGHIGWKDGSDDVDHGSIRL